MDVFLQLHKVQKLDRENSKYKDFKAWSFWLKEMIYNVK
jgi:hypothetical protein